MADNVDICIAQHRNQPVRLTERWNDEEEHIIKTEWKDVSDLLCSATVVHKGNEAGSILLSLGTTTYVPGDIRSRNYRIDKSIFKLELPPIAIRDLDLVTQNFKDHVCAYVSKFARNQGMVEEELLRLSTECDEQEGDFAELALEYCYLRAWSVGSLILMDVDKEEKKFRSFGMPKVPVDAESLGGRYVPSRLVVSQMQDVVRRLLVTTAQRLTKGFNQMVESSKAIETHLMYVFLVMLAKGNVTIFADRWRHGHENGQEGPSIPETIPNIKNNFAMLARRFQTHCVSMDYRGFAQTLPESAHAFHKNLPQSDMATLAHCGIQNLTTLESFFQKELEG